MNSRSILGMMLSVVLVNAPLGVIVEGVAHAEASSPPVLEKRREAARLFSEGEKAFKSGDFVVAGEAFDKAYALSPHHDVLWNAARAWQRAGESARAANLYARFVHDAPSDAADRPAATSALAQLGAKLGKIEVQAGATDLVWVDGAQLDRRVVYVNPGAHLVRIKSGDRDESTTEMLAAGSVTSVAQKPLTPAPAAAAAAPSPLPAQRTAEVATRRGVPPIVVWVGAGLTLGATGVAVWSGIDTLDAKKSFDASPTQTQLDDGHSKETRTNVVIAVSAGLFVATAATAIWLVDWRAKENVRVGVGPGSMMIQGSF